MSSTPPTHQRSIATRFSRLLRLLRRLQNRLITIDVYRIWDSGEHGSSSSPQGSFTAGAGRDLSVTPLAVTLEQPDPSHRQEPFCFAYLLRGRPVCTTTIRSAATYRRATLDLQPDEAKLIDVITAAEERGKGFAPLLIRDATAFMKTLGYERIYARIWHSNHASQRAFEKAGWRRTGTVLFLRGSPGVLFPLRSRMLRLSFFRSEAKQPVGQSRSRIHITTRPTRSLH